MLPWKQTVLVRYEKCVAVYKSINQVLPYCQTSLDVHISYNYNSGKVWCQGYIMQIMKSHVHFLSYICTFLTDTKYCFKSKQVADWLDGSNVYN